MNEKYKSDCNKFLQIIENKDKEIANFNNNLNNKGLSMYFRGRINCFRRKISKSLCPLAKN